VPFYQCWCNLRAPNMAKKSRQTAPGVSAVQPDTPLGKARWALESGDVRRARQLLHEAARAGPEVERAEARALLDRLGPDLRAIAVAAAVLVMIVLAAWLAILRPR
jgi:FimV-like protein